MTGPIAGRRSGWWPSAVAGAIAVVVYVRTLLPGMAFGDWGEMQSVPHVLGVAHPTGYPTYVVLSWLFHLVPVGSIAFRANLLSAVLVSVALAVTVAILLRLGGSRRGGSGQVDRIRVVATMTEAAGAARIRRQRDPSGAWRHRTRQTSPTSSVAAAAANRQDPSPTRPTSGVASRRTLAAGQATPVAPVLGVVGLGLLIRRRTAFGLMCAAILVTHLYVWSTYLRLEHYLLVAWLVLAIGAAVALDAFAQELASRHSAVRGWGRHTGVVTGAAVLVFALSLGTTNWQRMDRSGDRSAEVFVDTVLDGLPPDAAILTQWDASTPLWHATLIIGRRPDVLVVDDTNIVYDGWGSRERSIAALICERPVFIARLDERDLVPTREAYRLEPFLPIRIAQGGPSAVVDRQVFRVEPLDPDACGG